VDPRFVYGREIPVPRPTCRVRGFFTPIAASTTTPPDATSAPERPRASHFKAFSSHRWVLLSESLPSGRSRVGFVASHGERRDASGYRASCPVRARSAHALASACADAFLRFPPPGRSPSPSGLSLWSRSLPLHASRCDVHGPRASWGLTERRGQLVPLGTAGPPGVCRLATVVASRESRMRGAGSWIRLTARARSKRREPILAPSPPTRPDLRPARRHRPSADGKIFDGPK
jgi:hypothetical protein